MGGTLFSNVNKIQFMTPEDQKKVYNYTVMKYEAPFYSRHTSTKHKP